MMRRGVPLPQALAMAPALPLGFGLLWGGVTVAGVLALILAICAWVSVFRNKGLSGGAKAMWVVAILILPFLGSIVYFSVRSDW
jgi:hypothetical protein